MLPMDDRHFTHYLRDGTYQRPHREAALSYCEQYRVAVDVGAHVGLWARELEQKFVTVHAFEPVPANLACLALNTGPRVHVNPVALGDGSSDRATLRQIRAGNTGTWSVVGLGAGPLVVESRTLDSYQLDAVDFLKVDVECSELAILRGAIDTIERCHPVVCVELRDQPTLRQAGFPIRYSIDEVVELLADLGMVHVTTTVADWVFAREVV
jgi:FkbM family methyltransferase